MSLTGFLCFGDKFRRYSMLAGQLAIVRKMLYIAKKDKKENKQ